MARIDEAIRLRDYGLRLVASRGKSKLVGNPSRLAVRVCEYAKSGITIWHTPAGAAAYSERSGRTGAFRPGRSGLDIWTPEAKVLNIEWTADGEVTLRSFKRGNWEKKLTRLAS
jgi:hypothetical protein